MIELTGCVFGELEVLGRSSTKGKGSQAFWDCKCSCGRIQRFPSQSLRIGKSKRCKACGRPVSRIVGAATNALYAGYRCDARDRGYAFDITPEHFKGLIVQNCSYCGIEPLQEIRLPHEILKYNGIDRANNSLGYIVTNCVPCCKICNIAKRAMSLGDFLIWIKRAYHHNFGG